MSSGGIKMKTKEMGSHISIKNERRKCHRSLWAWLCCFSKHGASDAYSFVGFLLASVFWCFAWIAADLHVHGVDDVEEILHHCHAFQRRVHPGYTVHTLENTERGNFTFLIIWSKVHSADRQERWRQSKHGRGNNTVWTLCVENIHIHTFETSARRRRRSVNDDLLHLETLKPHEQLFKPGVGDINWKQIVYI